MRLESSAKADTVATKPPLRIVVVEDHIFMRELISGTLSRQRASYTVLASVGTVAAAIASCREFSPDLLIMDISLPDGNGIDAVSEIKRVSAQTLVLLCTAFPTPGRIVDALRVGANGFVEKTNTWDDFLVAVDRVGRGEQYFCSKSSGVLPPKNIALPATMKRSAGTLLSPREEEVVKLIALGSTSKEVASKLFISAATVETHRTNLMSKLGVHNVAGLVLYAFQNGLVAPSAGEKSLV